MLNTIYTKEEIQKELKELKEKRDTVRNSRVAILKKHQKKQGGTNSELHELDRRIENLQNKLSSLF